MTCGLFNFPHQVRNLALFNSHENWLSSSYGSILLVNILIASVSFLGDIVLRIHNNGLKFSYIVFRKVSQENITNFGIEFPSVPVNFWFQ